MTFRSRLFFAAAVVILAASSLFAQGGTTGTLTGVVSQDGVPLPGVTVTVSSPNLQGTRSDVTNEAGGYNFGALPPGDYTVRFDLQGMSTMTRRVHVGVAQNSTADAALSMSSVAEAIIVTAAAPAVAETTQVQTNFQQNLIEDLPMARNITAITGLAPGVVAGVNGFQISGGMSFDNLYTVNGANIQETLRGQPNNLFIEDAIQETTVQTAAVSAEYGNFTGGVINAITRSGGNEFSGSLRDSLSNPAWTRLSSDFYQIVAGVVTRTTPAKSVDQLNSIYEGTFGGRLVRDRLWFFLAGRQAEAETSPFFSNSNTTYARTTNDERKEGKLTAAITSRHNLVASYIDAPVSQVNNCQFGCYDMEAVDPRIAFPNDFYTGNYNGVITNNFLVEAKYAKMNFKFDSLGGDDFDLATGTPIFINAPGFSTFTNAPPFCGPCTDDERDSDSLGLKGTYYLGTRSIGNHNIVAGAERYHESRVANNHQSPTDFRLDSRTLAPSRDANGNTLVSFIPNAADRIIWFPIDTTSSGSDLKTDALYVNDNWNLNSHWSFNLGARFDMNHSKDAEGSKVADDNKLSPRLGATFDPFANGRLRLNASYGTYVGRLAETVASSQSAAGSPANYIYRYEGPAILNATPAEASRQLFAWFTANGFTDRPIIGAFVPGYSSRLDGTLESPHVNEWSAGASTQFSRGFLRADYIHRNWDAFYGAIVNLGTGTITSPIGARSDLQLTTNSDDLERIYNAVELQGEFRVLSRIRLGGNYTWSLTEGNTAGEDTTSGPFTSITSQYYPEYRNFDWNLPIGPLATDQKHKLRAWGTFDLQTFLGSFNFSVLERLDSGSPYQLTGNINIQASSNFYGTSRPGGISNPGYLTPPASVTYFFSDRGAFRFEDLTATDVAINYNSNPSWLRGVGFFVQAELINAFDEQAATGVNTAVLTHLNNATTCAPGESGGTRGCLLRFNPFAGDSPVESVQNADGTFTAGHYRKGALFGLPTASTSASTAGSFQTPRTYRVSLGFKF